MSQRTDTGARPQRPDPLTEKAEAFAYEVAAGLEGSGLRYSQRLALLRRAAGLGLGQFEASLIIAVVQHQRQAAAPSAERWPALRRWVAGVALGVVVEAIVVLILWAVFLA